MPSHAPLRPRCRIMEPPTVAEKRKGLAVHANNNLTLSRAQAAALARLIQTQLDAYDEAASDRPIRRVPRQAFTAHDLNLIEPLLVALQEVAQTR